MIPKKHQYTVVKEFKILISKFKIKTKKTLNAQGYGRHSANEIEDIAKKDLMALSTFLGEKPYFFGNQPSTVCLNF